MFIELDFPREIMEIGSQTGRVGRFLVRSWDELERHWKGKMVVVMSIFLPMGIVPQKPLDIIAWIMTCLSYAISLWILIVKISNVGVKMLNLLSCMNK